MIKHLRIDNRLIHGQVANTWIKSSFFDQVIACNDDAANNMLQKQLLLMTVRDIETKVLGIDETIKFTNKYPEMQAFVVVSNLKDAFEVIKSANVKEVNIGNLVKVNEEGVNLSNNIFLTMTDVLIVKDILNLGYDLTCQMLPNSEKIYVKDKIK